MVYKPDMMVFAHHLADVAGDIALSYFRTSVDVDIKSDESPVTRADREIETVLRTLIHEQFPEHGVLGEEFAAHQAENDYVWAIDPIDGTRAFLAGRPSFSTLVALCFKSTPILGLMDQPFIKERYSGAAGEDSLLNGKQITARTCKILEKATIATTSPHYFSDHQLPIFEQLRDSCKDVIYGGDAYNYMQLAAGFIDIVCEAELKAHDVLALRPIIEGAGGKISTWDGKPLTMQDYESVIAAGSTELHQAALLILANH